MPKNYVGVDLGGTHVRAGLVSGGVVKERKSEPIREKESGSAVLETILELAGSFMGMGIEAVGFGVPSVVDTKEGVVYDVQNIPGWEKVALRRIAEERFGVPVFVNNDANCFAIGEYHFGKGRAYESMVALNIGTGFAGGIVIGGRLYEGRNCGAGEFGTIPYRTSILEHYCAGLFFEQEYGLPGSVVAERAATGDSGALEIFREFGKHVGHAMKVVLYSFDPEAIILGGSVSRSFEFYRDSLMAELQTFAFQKSVEQLTIELSEEPDIAILGAAALCLE